ncbi:TIP41-like protein [Pyrus ussuriensis x Pyrus communis]|uniref:TIP41-like protein n=1 Tax=Pyrus ussuriensis x Pyrus communis TaxID=2448454 RepID=A0A5N5IE06_9ROSA|nr:TIP41-like protein [Pyrus ussuriensis x Pyrus communis]
MEVEVDDKELKAAGAEQLTDGRYGLRIHGWDIEWEQKLHTCHMPEMVFGDSGLFLKHVKSGATIHFNSFDALVGWKKEALPPVEVPAAAQWKFRTDRDTGYPSEDAAYNDPSIISQRLPVIMRMTQKLKVPGNM